MLKRVLAAYDKRGLKPVVAPEIEFYLVRKNPDPDYPAGPPVERSSRRSAAAPAIPSPASTNSTS